LSTPTPPSGLRLQVGARPRDPQEFPKEDDALGESLARMVLRSVSKGVPPPSALVLKPDQVEIIDLRPILKARLSVHRFIAAAAGQPGVDAVALLAVLDLEDSGRPLGRSGTAFVEWPDNRWWHGYHLLGQSFRPVDDMPLVVRRAQDGAPRPRGFGGWFSRARFQRLSLRLERVVPPPTEHQPQAETLVH
jgi:hypothetical protein